MNFLYIGAISFIDHQMTKFLFLLLVQILTGEFDLKIRRMDIVFLEKSDIGDL